MKKYLKISLLLFVIVLLLPSFAHASNIFEAIEVEDLDLSEMSFDKIDILRDKLKEISTKVSDSSIDENALQNGETASISISSVLTFYEEISEVLTNKELAEFIDKNEDILVSAGINRNLLRISSKLFKSFDSKTIIDIAKNNIDTNKILEDMGKSTGSLDLIKATINNTTTSDKISIIFKLLFSNNFFKLLFALIIVSSVYSVFITSYIFKKANVPGFVTLIPIYRDLIHLKMCNFSPWVILLILVPIIGWLALMAIAVIRKI